MRKLALLSSILATTLFATNGDNLIGLGAESRALGGTGIAVFSGAENALSNPALLSKITNSREFSFGGTFFKPTVKASTTASGANAGISRTSDEGASVIPVISIAHRLSDTLVFGLGMYGTAGMGTDWRATDTAHTGDPKLYNMRSSLMLMQFAPSIAYSEGNYGLGLTGILQYGQLSIDYDTHDNSGPPPNPKHVGSGGSSDFGYGFQLGGYYDISSALTIGAVYKSAIDMEYKDQISKAGLAFGYGSHPGALPGFSDHLEQPEEMGIGFSYNVDKMTYTADIKQIKWGSAKGYKDFGWEDQTVYALGARYTEDKYWYGAGINYAKSPLQNNTSTTSVAGGANTHGDTMNLFNYAMFPATTETAYTVGGGMEIAKETTLSFAYVYSPEVSDTVSGATVGVGNITTTHEQNALTLDLHYAF